MIEKKISLRRMVCVFFSLLQVRQAANPQSHARYKYEGIDVSTGPLDTNIDLLGILGKSAESICSQYDQLEKSCLDYKQVKNSLVQKGVDFDGCDIDTVDVGSDEVQDYQLLALSSSRWSLIRNFRTKQACGLAHETEDTVITGGMYCEQAGEYKEFCKMINDVDIASIDELLHESIKSGHDDMVKF